MYQVITRTIGTFYLRSTIWTSDEARADKFATKENAAQALARAKKFTNAQAFKRAQIIETT